MIRKLKAFLLENRDPGQTIAKNTIWLFIGQSVSRLLRAGIVIYAARVLTVGSWGAFSYALGIATFLTVFSDMGLNALITKTASRDAELRNRYVATAFGIKLCLIILLSLGTLFIFPRVTHIAEAAALMPIFLFLFAFDTVRDLGSAIARSMEKMQIEAGVHIFTNAAIVLCGLAALIFIPGSRSLAVSYAVGSGLGMLLLIHTFREEFAHMRRRFDRSLIRSIITRAWPFGLLGLMGVVMLNTDIIMVGIFRSVEDVGYYAAAQKFIQVLYMLPTFLAVAAFPALARTLTANPQAGKRLLMGAVKISLVGAIPLSIIGVLFGDSIMLALFGSAYAPAFFTFKILMASLVIVFPSSIVGNAIFAYDAERFFVSIVGVAIIGNIIWNLLLIPTFGIEGAAYATLITQIMTNGIMWSKLVKLFRASRA